MGNNSGIIPGHCVFLIVDERKVDLRCFYLRTCRINFTCIINDCHRYNELKLRKQAQHSGPKLCYATLISRLSINLY